MVVCKCCSSCSVKPYLIGYEMDDIKQNKHQYFECLSCSAIFLDHIPAPKDYDESGYYQRRNTIFSFIINILMNFFHRCRYKYVKLYAPNNRSGNLLDIGCGKGGFLAVAKQDGWNVTGIEPTSRSAEYARKALQIRVVESGLHDSNIDSSTFNVVTMWHVLEHLSYPSAVLAEINRILVQGGILIIAIPNINSLQAYIGKGKWFHLDPPRHVLHIKPKLLSDLLKQNGFQIERFHHYSAEHNIIGWFQTLQNLTIKWPNFGFNFLKRNSKARPDVLGRVIGHLSSVILLLLLPIIILLSLFESIIGRGGTITVVARKYNNLKS